MLTGSRLERMLGVVRRVALPIEARRRGSDVGLEAVLRRLAAIGPADGARYSLLMEANEDGMHARLRSLRRDLIDPKIARHKDARSIPPATAC